MMRPRKRPAPGEQPGKRAGRRSEAASASHPPHDDTTSATRARCAGCGAAACTPGSLCDTCAAWGRVYEGIRQAAAALQGVRHA